MLSNQNREDLEKLKLSLTQHLQSLEAKNKKLREKQAFLLHLAERLRRQERVVSDQISVLLKNETNHLQILSIAPPTWDNKMILFLN